MVLHTLKIPRPGYGYGFDFRLQRNQEHFVSRIGKKHRVIFQQVTCLEAPTIEDLAVMKMMVPEEVIRETTKCPKGHACLSNGSADGFHCCHGCEVDFALGKNLMFVKPNDHAAALCPYKMHYGSGHVCQCPVRYYLYLAHPQP
jgi:hypothetical protein